MFIVFMLSRNYTRSMRLVFIHCKYYLFVYCFDVLLPMLLIIRIRNDQPVLFVYLLRRLSVFFIVYDDLSSIVWIFLFVEESECCRHACFCILSNFGTN